MWGTGREQRPEGVSRSRAGARAGISSAWRPKGDPAMALLSVLGCWGLTAAVRAKTCNRGTVNSAI